MKFTETKLSGAYTIELEQKKDERGFFARSFCQQEFKNKGIDFNIVQSNISYNKKKGTLRGMHYQEAPHEEAKIVSCIQGSIYDVIIDLRPNSSTYCQWLALELSAYKSSETVHCLPIPAHDYKMLYIPAGFAHGFQTLEDDTVVFYQMSEFYYSELARGVRWDDSAFGIRWPESKVQTISDKDQKLLDFIL